MCGFVLASTFGRQVRINFAPVPVIAPAASSAHRAQVPINELRVPASTRNHARPAPQDEIAVRMPISNSGRAAIQMDRGESTAQTLRASTSIGTPRIVLENLVETAVGCGGGGAGGAPALLNRLCTTADSLE